MIKNIQPYGLIVRNANPDLWEDGGSEVAFHLDEEFNFLDVDCFIAKKNGEFLVRVIDNNLYSYLNVRVNTLDEAAIALINFTNTVRKELLIS